MNSKIKPPDIKDDVKMLNYHDIWDIYSRSTIPTLLLNNDGKILEINEAMEILTGYTHSEIISAVEWIPKLFPESEYQTRIFEIYEKIITHDIQIKNVLFDLKVRDGSHRKVSVSVYDVYLEGQRVNLHIIQGEDRTEFLNTNEQLKVTETNYKQLVENVHSVILRVDLEGKITFLNDYGLNLFGYSEGNIIGRKIQETIIEGKDETSCNFSDFLSQVHKHKISQLAHETMHLCSDSRKIWVSWTTNAISDADGDIVQVLCVGIDVTERKLAEDALRKRYAFEQIISNITATFIKINSDEEIDKAITATLHDIATFAGAVRGSLFLFSNDLKIVSNTHEWCADTTDSQIDSFHNIPAEVFGHYWLLLQRYDNVIIGQREDMHGQPVNGTDFHDVCDFRPVLFVPMVLNDSLYGTMGIYGTVGEEREWSEDIVSLLRIASDIFINSLERRKAERQLRESEEKYRSIIESSLEGIHISRSDIILFCNKRFATMFGFKDPRDAIGRPIKDFVSPPSWEMVKLQIKLRESGERETVQYKFKALRVDGSEFEAETLGSRVMYLGEPAIQGIMRDVSHQHRLEEQLKQAQKMEAVGRLAGGIAHDFNNLLTVISGHCDLALMQMSEQDPLRQDITEIVNATNRAANLTRQLLAFSRKQNLAPKVIDLNNIIHDMGRMLDRIIGEDVKLTLIPENNIWKVRVDPGQMEQVIVNLIINARDAMPEGGKLIIETSNVILNQDSMDSHPDIPQGSYVVVAVSDTGIGMTAEIKSQIFEPFFTTKDVGKGTGLGLSTVYGIVTQSGGHIQVFSKQRRGTTFKVYLPIVDEQASETAIKQRKTGALEGHETLLLVEDESAVRRMAARALDLYEYTVLEASTGADAFMLCQKRGKPVDLVITDVVMPNMNGVELAVKLRTLWPKIKVLFISGYADNDLIKQEIDEFNTPYLLKPFFPGVLIRKVREVLDT